MVKVDVKLRARPDKSDEWAEFNNAVRTICKVVNILGNIEGCAHGFTGEVKQSDLDALLATPAIIKILSIELYE